MFTGLVQDIGRLEAIERRGPDLRITVATRRLGLESAAIGDSIAVDGCCLTAVSLGPGGRFEAELSEETLRRTAFEERRVGDEVHLELASRLGDRLGGHLVQGHVDGIALLVARRPSGAGWELDYRLPQALLGGIIPKGSIALDGVSLTVAALADPLITIAVIPHTAERTTLCRRPVGARVNVETDMIGKYVQRLVELGRGGAAGSHGALDLDTLRKAGMA